MAERIAQILFRISITFLVFLLGGIYSFCMLLFGWWPYDGVVALPNIIFSVVEFGEIRRDRVVRRAPAAAPRETFAIYRPDLVPSGYFLVMAHEFDANEYAVRLYDNTMQLKHEWPISYEIYDPDGPLNGSDMPHGLAVLSDGSLILNFDMGDVMTRIDRCGRPIWVESGAYHHSFSTNGDGTFWTWLGENTPHAHYQYIVQFDGESGETLQKIGLVETILPSQERESTLFPMRLDFPFKHFQADPHAEEEDLFHPNDVEILSPEMAENFAAFEAGDLLISLRELNMLAVIDSGSHLVKWSRNGPWIAQHDPDFTADGMISVFNNNTRMNRSELLRIDPTTNIVRNPLLGGDADFSSPAMGKHQYLPDGGVLITSPDEGRVMLVTDAGDKIFEFNNVVNEKYNSHVENAIWLSASYFPVFPSCP
jgi:hypothetical protein